MDYLTLFETVPRNIRNRKSRAGNEPEIAVNLKGGASVPVCGGSVVIVGADIETKTLINKLVLSMTTTVTNNCKFT